MELLFVFFALLSIFSRFFYFFFNDTATTEIYTLSLHDALPISYSRGELSHKLRLLQCRLVTESDTVDSAGLNPSSIAATRYGQTTRPGWGRDRKSTRLNSSHSQSRMPSSA